METYPIDADPAQILQSLTIECEAAPAAFRIDAWRTKEIRPIAVRREDHLGDEEREDLTEIATVATLEIAPAQASDGWMLEIVVEDEVGPRIPDQSIAAEGEQVEGPAARAGANYLLDAIETNRHVAGAVQHAKSGRKFESPNEHAAASLDD